MTDKRQFKPRTRRSGLRDARLIIVATEGEFTERLYIEGLLDHDKFRNPRVHVEIISKIDRGPDPKSTLLQLDAFKREFKLNDADQLWLVIDLDRWGAKGVSQVAMQCSQKSYSLAVSNPCFEFWLLLHIKHISDYSSEEQKAIQTNFKVSRNKTWLKDELSKLGCGNETNLNMDMLIPNVHVAIQRARDLDTFRDHRWPQQLGTRVYLLVESMLAKEVTG